MSFRSILSGYPKILVRSIYLQYHNSQTIKQNKHFLRFVYVNILYIPLKLQNEYTEHVFISLYFLLNTVYKKFCELFRHIWLFIMSRKSFLSTIWHCNVTAPWTTLAHCWGECLTNLVLITAYYSCLTWKSLGTLYKVWVPKPWTGILQILNVTPHPTEPFSLVVNVYGELDYSPLVFNVCSSFLGWFVMFQKLAFLVFFFFFDFYYLLGWFSNGFTFQSLSVCLAFIK